MSQQPSVGRIVHYQPNPEPPYGENRRTGQPWAALITEVRGDDGRAQLKIFTPADQQEDELRTFGLWYPYSETPTPGHWSWPPRA